MVYVKNLETYTFLEALRNRVHDLWLGGRADPPKTLTYMWLDGSHFTFAKWLSDAHQCRSDCCAVEMTHLTTTTYSGRYNDQRQDKHTEGWRDVPCEMQAYAICQIFDLVTFLKRFNGTVSDLSLEIMRLSVRSMHQVVPVNGSLPINLDEYATKTEVTKLVDNSLVQVNRLANDLVNLKGEVGQLTNRKTEPSDSQPPSDIANEVADLKRKIAHLDEVVEEMKSRLEIIEFNNSSKPFVSDQRPFSRMSPKASSPNQSSEPVIVSHVNHFVAIIAFLIILLLICVAGLVYVFARNPSVFKPIPSVRLSDFPSE